MIDCFDNQIQKKAPEQNSTELFQVETDIVGEVRQINLPEKHLESKNCRQKTTFHQNQLKLFETEIPAKVLTRKNKRKHRESIPVYLETNLGASHDLVKFWYR